MLLAEQLAMVAIDPASAEPDGNSKNFVNAALCGLLAAEAGMDGFLVVERGVLVPASDARPDDTLLRDVVGALVESADDTLTGQLRRLGHQIGGVWKRVTERLAADGGVTVETSSHLAGLVHRTTWPVDVDARQAVVERLHAAATGTGDVDPATAVLVAVLEPANLLPVVVPVRDQRKQAKERARALVTTESCGPVPAAVVDAVTHHIGKITTLDR